MVTWISCETCTSTCSLPPHKILQHILFSMRVNQLYLEFIGKFLRSGLCEDAFYLGIS